MFYSTKTFESIYFSTDDFGLGVVIAEILCRDASWTLNPDNTMKVHKNPEKVRQYFSHVHISKQLINKKIGA